MCKIEQRLDVSERVAFAWDVKPTPTILRRHFAKQGLQHSALRHSSRSRPTEPTRVRFAQVARAPLARLGVPPHASRTFQPRENEHQACPTACGITARGLPRELIDKARGPVLQYRPYCLEQRLKFLVSRD